MSSIPATEQKLAEARYHLALLLGAAKDVTAQRHHLSALLAAGRSVTFVLQSEAKAEYDAWFSSWSGALTPTDQRLMAFMNEQRVAEVHRVGAAVSTTVEERSVWRRKSAGSNTPMVAQRLALGLHGEEAFGLYGEENVKIGVPTLMFEVDGGQKPARDVCARYVRLLEALVADFKRAFA